MLYDVPLGLTLVAAIILVLSWNNHYPLYTRDMG